MIGSLVFSAARISSRTRPSVVSVPARLTLISSTPVRFCVPAKTSSPGFLSAGSDSPVIVAWLNEPWPLRMTPSAATLSPGRMRITSPIARSLAATSSSPCGVMRRALVGVSLMRCSIEARAPSAVRVSMISPISMKKATTPAVLYSPVANAASTAMATSSLMLRTPVRMSLMAVQTIG